MPLPVPNLDDRRFQDLVDDAKRLVQQRCPEWTDHNVSDPGVTLIELFAWMTDQILYRLNRVPDLNYVKFLDLLGVDLFPPTAARGDVTFWLSAPRPDTLRIAAGTQVSSIRSAVEDTVTFTTIEELAILPCSVVGLASETAEGEVHSHAGELDSEGSVSCFQAAPEPGDSFLIGLSDNVPSCAIVVRLDCRIEGIGVDPTDPPLVWEAYNGEGWTPCELERDDTGGLNRPGDVVLHVPPTHLASLVEGEWAGWIRCRVTDPRDEQPMYAASPRVSAASAFTIGGTVDAVHADVVRGERVGVSDGVPAQRFALQRRPVVPSDDPRVLEVGYGEMWQEWEEVTSFADSEPDSRHFMLEAASGEISFGPAVRQPDGTIRQYGAVPPKDTILRLREYRTGGGPRGNVFPGVLSVLRSPIAYVSRVENRHAAAGGVDGEDIDNAKVRGPIVLRTGDRAVTLEDYEQLAREAAPELARVGCVPADDDEQAGCVRVLVVPPVVGADGRLRFEQLIPQEEQLEKVARHLDERRVIGVRLAVEPPLYQGITIVARVRARLDADPARLQKDALDSLYRHFNPVTGGADGEGWPFGRAVLSGEVFSLLQAVRGTDMVEDVRLFPADPTTGARGAAADRIELPPYALVFSYEHRVLVESD